MKKLQVKELLLELMLRHKALKKPPFVISRTQGYIGVMIDDLVTMSVDEPYRMFTSRAEYRLSLGQESAFARLTTQAHALNLVDDTVFDDFKKERDIITQSMETLRAGKNNSELLRLLGSESCDLTLIKEHTDTNLSDRAARAIQSSILYGPYLDREQKEIERVEQYQNLRMPEDFVYTDMSGLSKELQQKLTRIRPATLAQASLIPGMTPAALSLLLFKVRKWKKEENQ